MFLATLGWYRPDSEALPLLVLFNELVGFLGKLTQFTLFELTTHSFIALPCSGSKRPPFAAS
jgi:hypothetical protein